MPRSLWLRLLATSVCCSFSFLSSLTPTMCGSEIAGARNEFPAKAFFDPKEFLKNWGSSSNLTIFIFAHLLKEDLTTIEKVQMQSCAEGGGFRHCQQDERAGVKAAASSAEVSKRRGDHRQKSSTSSCRPYSVKASRKSSGAATRSLFHRRGAMRCPPPEDFPRDLGACSPCAISWLSRLFHTSSRPRDAGTNSAEVSTLSRLHVKWRFLDGTLHRSHFGFSRCG